MPRQKKTGLVLGSADYRQKVVPWGERGLVWPRYRLGHSSVAVTERYLRNVPSAETGKMLQGRSGARSQVTKIQDSS